MGQGKEKEEAERRMGKLLQDFEIMLWNTDLNSPMCKYPWGYWWKADLCGVFHPKALT